MIRRSTGLRPATDAQRVRVRKYLGAAVPRLTLTYPIIQPIARIIDQDPRPACVGCTMCACGEAVFGIPPHLSWVRIWTDARRRDHNIGGYDDGTWFTSAIDSVMTRGFDPEEPGEWNDLEEMTEPDDLDSEMSAYDARQTDAEHWRVSDGDLDAVDDALARGLGVGIGTGVRDPYFAFFSSVRSPTQPDLVLDATALGGYSNGHEQRIVAVERVTAGREYLIQNSWGLCGGAHLPDGRFQLGLARASESVLRAAWDLDVIEIMKRDAVA